MARRRTPSVADAAAGRFVRLTEWAGLHEGDPVDVLDAVERGVTWSFAAHVTNVQSEETWVEVVGGRAGEQRRRSFRPEQLYPHRSLRSGSATCAPLCDVPRLPL
jgi:hypothetical protein